MNEESVNPFTSRIGAVVRDAPPSRARPEAPATGREQTPAAPVSAAQDEEQRTGAAAPKDRRNPPPDKRLPHDPFFLGTRLVELGDMTPDELTTAKAMYRAHPAEGFATALERLSFATQAQIARLIAERYVLPCVEIKKGSIVATLVRRLPQVRANHHVVVPYQEEPGMVHIAVADPQRYTAADAQHDFPRTRVVFVVAAKGDILAAIADAYTVTAEGTSPREVLDSLIKCAASDEITDIHIEPKPNAVVVRRRRDGRLHHHVAYDPELKRGLVQAAKTMANLDFSASALPMDGQAKVEVGASKFNLRISTVPTTFGENVVIRLQNETRNLRGLTELGLDSDQIKALVQYAASPEKLILVCGPTNSGKTTLLYALMGATVSADEAILTIENPIEYTVPAYTQCQVDEASELTFAVLLRAFVRQDPDRILVGEIRDKETADIAIKAALTGHQVFSTLHTPTAPGAVVRLLDIGVEPHLIVAAIKAVVGTRLVRVLCSCAKPMAPDKKEFTVSKYGPGEYREAKGCDECRQTGFKGQTLIAEIYPMDKPGTAELVMKKASIDQLTAHMHQYGRPMMAHGLAKAAAGITTIEEILSAVGN